MLRLEKRHEHLTCSTRQRRALIAHTTKADRSSHLVISPSREPFLQSLFMNSIAEGKLNSTTGRGGTELAILRCSFELIVPGIDLPSL